MLRKLTDASIILTGEKFLASRRELDIKKPPQTGKAIYLL